MDHLINDLTNIANKLRAMWGNNPDSIRIEEAVEVLKGLQGPEVAVEAAEAQPRTKRTSKKED